MSSLRFDLIFRYFSSKIMLISKKHIQQNETICGIFKRGGAGNCLIRLTQYPPLVGITCISYLKLKPVYRSVNGDSALKFIIAYRLLICETFEICEFLNGSLLLFKSFHFTYKQCLFVEALTLFQTEFTFKTTFSPVLVINRCDFFIKYRGTFGFFIAL